MRPSWNEYFMAIAKIVSTRSTCLSRPTGCVITNQDHDILATGYNGSISGQTHCTDLNLCQRRLISTDEEKYNYCVSNHAEANAIARAAKRGVILQDSSIYITLTPCYVCLKLLVSAGIKHIYAEYEYESKNVTRDAYWKRAIVQFDLSYETVKLSESNLSVIYDTLSRPTSERRLPSV